MVRQAGGRFALFRCSLNVWMQVSSPIDWPETLIDMLTPRVFSMLRYEPSICNARVITQRSTVGRS